MAVTSLYAARKPRSTLARTLYLWHVQAWSWLATAVHPTWSTPELLFLDGIETPLARVQAASSRWQEHAARDAAALRVQSIMTAA